MSWIESNRGSSTFCGHNNDGAQYEAGTTSSGSAQPHARYRKHHRLEITPGRRRPCSQARRVAHCALPCRCETKLKIRQTYGTDQQFTTTAAESRERSTVGEKLSLSHAR